MFHKLTLAAALGAGYVLGAKAGRERYTQLEAKFREVAGMPTVQKATANVKEAAVDLAETAKTAVNDKVEAVSDKASDKRAGTGVEGLTAPTIDLDRTAGTTPGTSTAPMTSTAPVTGGAPMAGAAPSVTASVIARP